MKTATEIMVLPPMNIATLRMNLAEKDVRKAIAPSLAKGLTYEKLCQQVLIAANKDQGKDQGGNIKPKKILFCTMTSIIECMRAVAEFNLDCSGLTNEIALVPRKTTLTYVVQYQGYMALMRRSGNIRDIEAAIVYENDKCLYQRGIKTVLEHEPDMSGERGNILWAYAIAHYHDGTCHVETIDGNDIDDAESYTKGSFWNKHPGPMVKKTAILRLKTYVEWSIDVAGLLGMAGSQEYGDDDSVSEPEPVPTGISMEDIEAGKATVEVNEHKEPPLEKPVKEKLKTKPKRVQKKKQEPQQEEVDIYDQAVEFVRQRALGGNRVTIPDLKRKLRIGGDQAMRLFERLKRSDIDPAFWEMPIKEEQPPHSADDEPKQELPLEQPPKKKAVRESPADRTLRIIAWSDNEIGGVDNRPIGLDDIIWMTCLDTWQELSKEPTIPQMVEASELSNRAASNVIRALQGFWPIGTPEHSDLQRQFEWVSV